MKKLMFGVLVLGIAATSTGQVSLKVYEADGTTLFDCNDDIMVGYYLTIIVSSDCNESWTGGLFVRGQDRTIGNLFARDYDPNYIIGENNDIIGGSWTGSHYENAGYPARVLDWQDSLMSGFDLYTPPSSPNDWPYNPVTGDWFIIDYEATEVGNCSVGFYDYSVDFDEPINSISFTHTPTRDLNADYTVNFSDFAIFSTLWKVTGCSEPNWCEGADLDRDGNVDTNDLQLLVQYWLWPWIEEEPNDLVEEPNDSNEVYSGDPNIIYRIVDINDNNEITIDVNDSITLYVRLETIGANNVANFCIEVDISDTNLGVIDNTEYDSNDPPGLGTARILSEPDRWTGFDYWGPGINQEDGILLEGIHLNTAIYDGNLASFIFTCQDQGDVTLELTNWHSSNTNGVSVFPTLESITIHQIDPNTMETMGCGEYNVSDETIDERNNRLVEFLQNIWLEVEYVRENYSEDEWERFIESVRNSD